jgi:hypothetical protein
LSRALSRVTKRGRWAGVATAFGQARHVRKEAVHADPVGVNGE